VRRNLSGYTYAIAGQPVCPVEDAVRIRTQSRVLFHRWGGDTPLEGVVRTVEPAGFTKISALEVEEQRVWVIADLVTPPEAWRFLGYSYAMIALKTACA